MVFKKGISMLFHQATKLLTFWKLYNLDSNAFKSISYKFALIDLTFPYGI